MSWSFFRLWLLPLSRPSCGTISAVLYIGPAAACTSDAMLQQAWWPADWSWVEANDGLRSLQLARCSAGRWRLAQNAPLKSQVLTGPKDCGVLRGDRGNVGPFKAGCPQLLRRSRPVGGAKAPHLPSAGTHARPLLEHSGEGPLLALGCNAASPRVDALRHKCG